MPTEESQNLRISDHLANERTFLAWIRTSVGIMAFGFVVVKFSLIVRQLSLLVNTEITTGKGYSGLLGISLVAIGSPVSLLAFLRYKRIEKQINNASYSHSSLLISFLVAFILLMSFLLIAYLLGNI